MNVQLEREDNVLAEGFSALASARDVAELLEVQYRDLTYWLYRSPIGDRYREFTLAKRSGGDRRILTPNTSLKILQQKLSRILYRVYRPRPCVHGFVPGKSVATNAKEHVRNRMLLNLDLQDFFPSINFGRVRGVFLRPPYNIPPDAATVLARFIHEGAPCV